MPKKLTITCLSLTAFAAFVLPAAAQAVNHPVLTAPTGTPLAVSSLFVATSTESLLQQATQDTNQLACTMTKLTGKLISNVTGNVSGDITVAESKGPREEGACTGIFDAVFTWEVLPWCIRSNETMGADEFTISGGFCTEAPKKLKFTLAVVGNPSQKCTYESTGTTAFRGTFATDTVSGEDAILRIPRPGHTISEDSGFSKITDDVIFNLCPSTSALKVTLTLETDPTSGTAQPIYISE